VISQPLRICCSCLTHMVSLLKNATMCLQAPEILGKFTKAYTSDPKYLMHTILLSQANIQTFTHMRPTYYPFQVAIKIQIIPEEEPLLENLVAELTVMR
jgi:hypothetical protein